MPDPLPETSAIPPVLPEVPVGLGVAGRRAWETITSRWDCDPDELVIIEQVASCVDEITALRVALARGSVMIAGSRGQERLNPAVTALAEHRRVLRHLLAGLRVPARENASSASSNAGRGLAVARWEKGGGARGA